MKFNKLKFVLVCHYAASMPDLLPLYELLLSKGCYVRFLFTDGWLLGAANKEGTHRAEDIKEEIRKCYPQTIYEIDLSDVIKLQRETEKKDLIFF